MTLKLESTTTELRKGCTEPKWHVCKSWEDYGKIWMHFVYKLDHLFQSTRVSDENSSISKAFNFSKLISNQEFFLHSIWTIQSHVLKFQPFLTSLYFFMHLMIYFELNDPEIGKRNNQTQKRLKLCMVSSLDLDNMFAEVERITAKSGCTSYTN